MILTNSEFPSPITSFFGKVYWTNIDTLFCSRYIRMDFKFIFKPWFCCLKIAILLLLIMYKKAIRLKRTKVFSLSKYNWSRNANVAIGKIPNPNGLVLCWYILLLKGQIVSEIFQNTNEKIWQISALAPNKSSNKKK